MDQKAKKPTPLRKTSTSAQKQPAPDSSSLPQHEVGFMSGHQVFCAEVSPINWLAYPWISPGRPTLLHGKKDTAKSLVAQDLLLSVTYGRPWLSAVPVQERGKALYLDFEAKVPTHVRLRQLADFTPDEYALNNIRLYNPPPCGLTPTSEPWLLQVCAGMKLVVVDSLAAASRGLKENDTEIRGVVDMLTRVSLATGAAVLLVHHEGHDNARARGSSAISQGCGAEIRMSLNPSTGRFTMSCVSPGPSGERPDDIELEVRAVGGKDPNTRLAKQLLIRPPEKMPTRTTCGTVVDLSTARRKRTPSSTGAMVPANPKKAQAGDAELLARARELFNGQRPSAKAIRAALNIGTKRASWLRDELQK